MTTQNLRRYADDPNAPFWEMLKTGSDAFFAAGRPPTVVVCDRRYVFNPVVNDNDLDPSACPYRKSNPDVLMVQSSQERPGNDAANGLDRPRNRCILAQR
jgi:murein L,D-transpeptidase YafK